MVGADDIDGRLGDQQDAKLPEAVTDENRLSQAVRNFEFGLLSQVYKKHAGNIAAAARELGMDRGNLSKKLKQLGIE